MKFGQYMMCGSTKTQFITGGVTSGSFLNSAVNKLPSELYLPGHNLTGPGPKLVKRLNADGTPKNHAVYAYNFFNHNYGQYSH